MRGPQARSWARASTAPWKPASAPEDGAHVVAIDARHRLVAATDVTHPTPRRLAEARRFLALALECAGVEG